MKSYDNPLDIQCVEAHILDILGVHNMTEVEELVPNGEFSWEKRGLEFDGAPTAEVSDISDYDDRRAVDVEAARGNVYAALDAIDKVA